LPHNAPATGEFWVDGTRVGTVHGFDACHFPHHYNILVHVPRPRTGADLGLFPRTAARFSRRGPAPASAAAAGSAG
jgi:hypothetical protein